MSNDERLKSLIRQADEVDCGNYDLRYSEMVFLANEFDRNFMDAFCLLYKIGFLKGQRAEKARQKKKRQSVTA